MRWMKRGLILEPNKDINWMSAYCGPAFVQVLDKNNTIRMYFSGRAGDNISRIGYVDIDSTDMKTINYISKEPVLDKGELGCFDERGVAYPWIIDVDDKKYMYFVGWIQGGIGGFILAVGMAISKDEGKSFKRISKVPILERIDNEPIGTGEVCVIADDNIFKLWYTSFVRWAREKDGMRHYYHIRYAESKDGIHWVRDGKVAIDFENSDEYAICKPVVIQENGMYKMWYSYRGKSYRIGYAESKNGIDWKRMDENVGIDVSESGWDSQMIEYAHVFDNNNERFMVYNGNNFGQTGIGLAVLEQE